MRWKIARKIRPWDYCEERLDNGCLAIWYSKRWFWQQAHQKSVIDHSNCGNWDNDDIE